MTEDLMHSECLARKRIWEVDCRSMEVVIAASFEWRELADLMKGQIAHCSPDERMLETQTYGLIHQCCHSENPISVHIEQLLNYRYRRHIETTARMDPGEVLGWVLSYAFDQRPALGGMIWAIGSDRREGFDCIARHFHQRLQIYTIRKLL